MDQLVYKYFSMGLSYDEIILFLGLRYNLSISKRTLHRRLRTMHLYRRKNYANHETLLTFLRGEINSSGQLHGYKWMHLRCLQAGLIVPQESIRLALNILDPQGVQLRKRSRLRRRQYFNKGPNYLWHLDSYDKLKPYGIAINGCIDGFSRHIMWLKASYTNSDPKIIAGYFMEVVRHLEGCPKMLRTDMGTENRYVEQIQNYFNERNIFHEIIFIYGRSTANQRIESWWSILRKHSAQFWMNFFQIIRDIGLFDGSFLDKSLIQFVFLDFVQRSRHHRDSFTSDSPETTHITLLETNPCLVQYCTKGRECVVESGEAKCVCQRECPPHRRTVCGSDGILYSNHCELHRAACSQSTAITAVRVTFCSKQGKGWPPIRQHRSETHEEQSTARAVLSKQDVTTSPAVEVVNTTLASTTSKESSEEDTENPFLFSTTEDPDYLDNEIDDESDDAEEKNDLYYDKEDCTMQEYEVLKDNLLLYNHARLMSQDNHSKDYLVSIMFSHYDRNNNGNLEATELNEISVQERLDTLSNGCSLSNMIQYDDTDHDGKLSINEFYVAFSKLYSVYVVSLDKALETNHLSARVGDNVEIKCDVTGSPVPPIVWRRNHIDLASLNEEEVRVFGDGSLYLTRIQLQHAGNYTCHAQRNKDIVQTHVLTVHTVPEVHVTPRIQSKRPGEDASMLCHVAGEPFPKVQWLKNDEPLKMDAPRKYQIIGNGTALKLRNIVFADTGAYMCQATSIGGLTRDISSLVVQEQPTPSSPNEERRFFAFHDWGVSIYEPSTCRLYHRIQSTDIIPGTQEYVCGDKGIKCEWGRAINVANRYVYASQPNRDRILIISKIQMVVVDVVSTDKYPVDLHHVPHLDQVWVLNWRSPNDTGIKTIQVIRDAGQKRKHHTVHPEPIDGQFDLVTGLFIPAPSQELSHYSFKYGYVTHTNQRGLYKLDLVNLRYTRSVDLTPYNCVPAQVRFSALYGMVIMQCLEPVTNRPTGQLILDYLTDSVIGTKPNLPGVPFISPDSRKLVTLDRTTSGATLIVQEITPNGLIFIFDVKTSLNISDVTFYPSQSTHSYDIYATAQDKEGIVFLNLLTGKVEVITGVGRAIPIQLSKWGNPNRPISGSGLFGQYMVTPASEALFVINGRSRTVNCEIGAVSHPSQVVWTILKFH